MIKTAVSLITAYAFMSIIDRVYTKKKTEFS